MCIANRSNICQNNVPSVSQGGEAADSRSIRVVSRSVALVELGKRVRVIEYFLVTLKA